MSEYKNNKLNNYFMKPTQMNNKLFLYPISIYDYEEFSKLANKFIVLDIKSLNNLAYQNYEQECKKQGIRPRRKNFKKSKFDNLYDYIINDIIENIKFNDSIRNVYDHYNSLTNEEKEIIKNTDKDIELKKIISVFENKNNLINLYNDFIKFIKFVTKADNVIITYDKKIKIKINKDIYFLDKDNFYEFRDIVMKQNLLHEPLIMGNSISQKAIDEDLEYRMGDSENDIEAMVAYVSLHSNKDINNYTYYRLRADFNMLMTEKSYDSGIIYNANGCKTKKNKSIPIPNILNHLSIHDNPYKDMFHKMDYTIDKMISK